MKKRFMSDNRREFYRNKDNQPFELVTVSNSEGNTDVMLYTVRQLFGDEDLISYVQSDFEKTFTPCTQASLFEIENDDEYRKMMERVGIGYICPFCGGYLRWNSDFMTSEVRGMTHCYVLVEDDRYIKEHEDEFRKGNILIDVESIETEEAKFEQTGEYEYAYLKCGDQYYVADDPVIGIYTCSNCGKEYEIQDCPISEQHEYPFYQEDNE